MYIEIEIHEKEVFIIKKFFCIFKLKIQKIKNILYHELIIPNKNVCL